MRYLRLAACLVLAGVLVNMGVVFAHVEFRKALVKHLELKKSTSVSCNSCHLKGKPKSMVNDFGRMFSKEFEAAGVEIPEKLADDEAKASAREAFLDALKKIELKEFPGGGTYGEALRSGKIDGVKTK